MWPRSNPSDQSLPTAPWTLLPHNLLRLEDRIVLDAAGGDAEAPARSPLPVLDASDPAALPASDAVPAHPHVLLISSDLAEHAVLAEAARSGVTSILFHADQVTPADLLAQVRAALHARPAASIALATHGIDGQGFELTAGHVVNLASLHDPQMQAFWKGLAEILAPGGRIDLLACNAASGPEGQAVVSALESLTGVNFAASTNATGNAAHGGDWLLETDQIDAASIYFDPQYVVLFDDVLAGPRITDSNPSPTATGAGTAIVVDPNITVTGEDGLVLTGAIVRIRSGFVAGEDVLAFTPTAHLSGSYDANTGILTITGNADAAEMQELLRSVTYQNTSTTPNTTPREIIFVVGADFDSYYYLPETGHYYQVYDPGPVVTWSAARAGAAGMTLGGLQGYLATVTRNEENALLAGLIPAFPLNRDAWLGGSDATNPGQWYWVTGPEAGTQFWNGDTGGNSVGGMYNNWQAGYPSAAGPSGLSLVRLGAWWRDVADGVTRDYYAVEFGGLSSDTEGDLLASVSVSVQAPNHAPVLDNSGHMSLAPIDEDARDNAGTSVASIIASAGGDRITDYNNDPEGIAVTALDTSHGTWQYSLDNGRTWHDISYVSFSHALLLRDSDLLRFRPDTDWSGTLSSALTFRAWDQTSGSAGDYLDVSTNGGQTAFSSATETAALTVSPVNDAPRLAPPGKLWLAPIDEDDLYNVGTTIADLLTSAGTHAITDVDAGAVYGIAIVGLDTSHGTWQYSLDNGRTWHDISYVSFSHALLLRDSDVLRFRPDTDWNGTLSSALTFRAWDQTSGSAGQYVDASVGGGTTAFSAASHEGGLAVRPVNDAPVLLHPLADQQVNEGGSLRYQFPSGSFYDADGDQLSYTATLADGSPLPNWLIFDPATRTFRGNPGEEHVGTWHIKVSASDGQGGVVAGVLTITVTDVNHAPELVRPLPDHNLAPDQDFHYQVPATTFQDRDSGDTLSFSATLADGSPLPRWLTFDPQTRTFAGRPGAADAGTLQIKVTADDGHGGQATDVFVLTVRAAASAPANPPAEPPASPPDLTPPSQTSAWPAGPGPRPATRPGTDHWHTDLPGSETDHAGTSGAPTSICPPAGETVPLPESPVESGGTSGEGPSVATGAAHDTAAPPAEPAAPDAAVPAAAAMAGVATPPPEHHETQPGRREEEEIQFATSDLGSQVQTALFDGVLLTDESVPSEFREAWHTILSAYADSGEELAAYLESAFRIVTESACVYQAAEQALAALAKELDLAEAIGLGLSDAPVVDLHAAVLAAREHVKLASAELQAAINQAALAGARDQFDRVLEDVISAALQRLMNANEQLYVESQAVLAVAAGIRSARLNGSPPGPAQLAETMSQARHAAAAQIAELRKNWDRVAQDVFAAFVARLVAQQAQIRPGAPPG